MHASSEKGFTFIEVMIAMGILTVGVLGVAAVLAAGVQNLSSSPGDVVVTQKAAQAIEAVFAARDSHKLTWAQIRNVDGEDGDDGIFLDDAVKLYLAGPDGLVNTLDDSDEVETVTLPGKDGTLETEDDLTIPLSQYTRQITIRDVPGTSGQLRSILVTMTYPERPDPADVHALDVYFSLFIRSMMSKQSKTSKSKFSAARGFTLTELLMSMTITHDHHRQRLARRSGTRWW